MAVLVRRYEMWRGATAGRVGSAKPGRVQLFLCRVGWRTLQPVRFLCCFMTFHYLCFVASTDELTAARRVTRRVFNAHGQNVENIHVSTGTRSKQEPGADSRSWGPADVSVCIKAEVVGVHRWRQQLLIHKWTSQQIYRDVRLRMLRETKEKPREFHEWKRSLSGLCFERKAPKFTAVFL